jgi:hypothetical protein
VYKILILKFLLRRGWTVQYPTDGNFLRDEQWNGENWHLRSVIPNFLSKTFHNALFDGLQENKYY